MANDVVIVWFRQDLRLTDHPALTAALADGARIVPLYVLDDAAPGAWAMGGASRWWLHHSLASLEASLAKRNAKLILRHGDSIAEVSAVARETGARAVFCSRAYEPYAVRLESKLHKSLAADRRELKRYPGTLLYEPETVRTKGDEPFRVYTPFWRAATQSAPRKPMAAPKQLDGPDRWPRSDTLASWLLLPTKPDWAGGMREAWTIGETPARKRLDTFLARALETYGEERNRPDRASTSRLSPHLHFGEISPAICWHAAVAAASADPRRERGLEVFLKELVWREFSYHLLFHWPELPEAPFRPEFAGFPWAEDTAGLRAWQKGMTGYPIVDGGMRELWTTGWMHNRVRMITASFLVKHLLIPWQAGERWFWDCLVDADLASNAASWQWVAGSGADAAPYFRIFNPVKQGLSFDPDGAYVRRWVPELAHVPTEYIHMPWACPEELWRGRTNEGAGGYPAPIVDHAEARARALAAFAALKK
jgi:deoxyribodipyrimidine photo-lyase